MDEWKTIEPGVWKPEKDGDNIIGVLINKEPKDEQTGFSARYYLENENGMFFVWGLLPSVMGEIHASCR